MINTTVSADFTDRSDDLDFTTEDVPDIHVNINEDGLEPTCIACGTECDSEGNGGPNGPCDESDDGLHQPDFGPFPWVNSVSVRSDDTRVMVSISVGDPRGAFTMYVERMQYRDLETGEEIVEHRLCVPHSDESQPHMTLTPLASPGYYKIG